MGTMAPLSRKTRTSRSLRIAQPSSASALTTIAKTQVAGVTRLIRRRNFARRTPSAACSESFALAISNSSSRTMQEAVLTDCPAQK